MLYLKIFITIALFSLIPGEERLVNSTPTTLDFACQKKFDKSINLYVYLDVTKEASFPGGPAAWVRFVYKNLQYPQDQITNETYQTTSVATFVVKSSGELTNLGIKGKIFSEWTSLDSTFISLVKKSGRWIPAECEGEKVASYFEQSLIVHIEL